MAPVEGQLPQMFLDSLPAHIVVVCPPHSPCMFALCRDTLSDTYESICQDKHEAICLDQVPAGRTLTWLCTTAAQCNCRPPFGHFAYAPSKLDHYTRSANAGSMLWALHS